MLAMEAVTMSNGFFDSKGVEINKEDIVWFDPIFVDVESSSIMKEPFIVVGLSKTNYDILLVPKSDHTNLFRTEMISVTHEDPYNHET